MTDHSSNHFLSEVMGKTPKPQDSSIEIGRSQHASYADEPLQPHEQTSLSHSELPHEARRVLVYLMRQGVIMALQKPKIFEQLCLYETPIRRHLSEVYLQLVLDQKSGVAFVASSSFEQTENSDNPMLEEIDSEESTSLISKRTLSLYDTLILLVLRKHYQERETAGEQKIIIDIEQLESYLTPFSPISDHGSKDRKKLLTRVKEMTRRKVLSTIRGTEDRYEITPIIRYVVSANFLESMLSEYQSLASEHTENPLVLDKEIHHEH